MARRKSPLDDPSVSVEPPRPGIIHLAIVSAGLALFGCLYFYLAGVLIETTNQDLVASDQKHNVKRALLSRQYQGLDISGGTLAGFSRWWPHDTDGIVAPLWPRVAGVFSDPEQGISADDHVSLADEAFFKKGKWINVTISYGFLCLLTLGAAWLLPGSTLGCLNLMLLAGLGALLPRAVYFHPEPIYYAFFAGTWFFCLVALLGNRWWPYAAAGLFAGLAYLTKTSVQPLLLAFAGICALRLGFGFLGFGRDENHPFRWSRCAGGLILLFAIFTAVVWPRLEFSRQRFGDRFHTYPAYWMWMDMDEDFGIALRWMQAHPDLATLTTLDPSEKPGLMNYWNAHTGEEIRKRAADGWIQAMGRSFFPVPRQQFGWKPRGEWKHLLPGRGWYLIGMTAILLGAAALAWRFGEPAHADTRRFIPRATSLDRFLAVVFVLGTFGGYSLAYGWYEDIGGGERFLLSLYVPLVFSLFWGAESLKRHLPPNSRWHRFFPVTHAVLLGFLLFRVVNLLAHPVFWEKARA